MKQLRIVGLGDYDNYFSYFTYSIMEGAIRTGNLFRPVPFFGHDLSVIKEQILWFKPHILIAHMLFGCGHRHDQSRVFQMLRDMRQRGIYVVYHNGDARKDPRYCGDISPIVDLGLLNQSDLAHYQNIWRVPCIRWPYMCLYQKEIADPVDLYKCSIAFTGGIASKGVHKERTDFVNTLQDRGCNVKLFPTNETGNTRFQTAELAASANMVLGMQMERQLKGYLDVRPFQYIGAGALYLHDKCEQMDEYFESGRHYIRYDKSDIEGFIANASILNKGGPMVQAIREYGFKYCQNRHSTKQRMEEILKVYKEK